MLELILILAVVVYLVSKLDTHHFEQAEPTRAGLGATPRPHARRRAAPRHAPRDRRHAAAATSAAPAS